MRDLVSASIIAISALVTSGGNARGDELVDAIDKAWRERGEKFKSGRVKWTVTTTFVAGGLNLEAMAIGGGSTSKKVENGLQIPERDTVVKSAHAMTMIGSDMRYDFDTIKWSYDTLTYYKKPCKSFSTGNKTISYQPGGLGSGDARTGFHSNEKFLRHALQADSMPVTVSCLPCAKYYDEYAIKRLGKIAPKQLINGMVELQCTPSKNEKIRLLCDAQRGYALTVIEHINGADKLLDSFQIRYQDDPVLGSFPASWTSERHDIRGRLVFRLEAKVDSYEINTPITLGDIEFDLERGCLLYTSDAADE